MDPSSSAKRQRDANSDDELEQPNCKRPKNDVFMNYSYEDIGKQFISHLQGALSRRGFTISDHTMLPAGQDMHLHLLKAIEESEIYVVVFSNNYASSVRSLDELVNIMDCLGKFEQRKILPVFYKVEPSDVRSQEGSFKEAFQAHEANEDIDSERVQKWKQALKEAGQLCGQDLTLQNGDEGKCVLKIVKQLEKMQSPQELHVADHPVVLGSRAEELISTLRLDCDDVLVVAVFGISGIGKTTIVKATYNKTSSYFDVSCFLEDINRRYNGRNDWKFKLQKDLISQLNKDGKVNSRLDGVSKIQNLLRRKKTLLVLDDVDHFKRLEGLGIDPLRFYKGSRIIVTTRDVDSLGGIPHTSYHTRLLNQRESRKLFIRLMFARDEPVHAKFVEEVVARAGGLPLVLKVWSRHFTQYKEHLPAALKTLKQIPHGDVQKQLQMSFDSLSPEAKNLFLDIACFFNGFINKGFLIKVLSVEGLCLDFEIEKLAHKFLVEKHGTCVSLPDVIMKMGREVVRQENTEEPGQRTRLMGHRDVVRVFREYSGTDSVRSIQLGYTYPDEMEEVMEEEATVQLEAFKKMSNLRFIKLHNSKLHWSSSSNDDMSACFSFKHVKYLEWEGFPCKSLDNIDMGNVVVIKLRHSKLEKLWEGVKVRSFSFLISLYDLCYTLAVAITYPLNIFLL
ncbi:TMV resistance protein N [Artemisia annua]|uniref:TMV resistance protein N n=1 Tax=Artemisia annua TaxID=35608 RepID=A0A2U1QGD5_ARTAN|nr:TMV resistance protein N [Artemisia annua]